jgi:hypothetical protein
MVGILDAQVAKQTPERKKNTLRKSRSLSFDSVSILPEYPPETNVVRPVKKFNFVYCSTSNSIEYKEVYNRLDSLLTKIQVQGELVVCTLAAKLH